MPNSLFQFSSRADWFVAVALLLLWGFGVYLPVGFEVTRSSAASASDLLFGADIPRVIDDLTSFSTPHWRTVPHPLFVILFNPIGEFLSRLMSNSAAAAVLVAGTGGLAVGLEYLVVRAIGLSFGSSMLFACVLGASGAHFVFSTAPETYIFSSTVLIFLALLLQRRVTGMLGYVLGGVLAFGILITNIVQAAIFYFASRTAHPRLKGMPFVFSVLRKCLIWFLLVMTIAASLNAVQRVIYPGAGLFFNPKHLGNESKYLRLPDDAAGWADRLVNLAATLTVVNFVPPMPNPQSGNLGSVTLGLSDIHYDGVSAWIGVIAVAGLWAGSMQTLFNKKTWEDPTVVAIALCLFFNFALHTFYGVQTEFYLYACNWTPLVVLLWARSWRDTISKMGIRGSVALNLTLAALTVACLLNSNQFMATALRGWSASVL